MNKEKTSRTEEILSSFDGMKRAVAPDFFYTRLKARLERQVVPGKKPGVLRPVYAFAALLIVLMINAAVLFNNNDSSDTATINSENEPMQSLAAEYSVTDAGSLYDLNLEK